MTLSYPQPDEYSAEIQHPATAFFDPELRAGRVRRDGLGLPHAVSGEFAVTYQMTTRGRPLAVRCFRRHIPEIDRKYAAIASALERLDSRYFASFVYLERGIRLPRGRIYPVVKMEWIDGDTFDLWLDRNYRDAAALERVRAEFLALASFLQRHGIAHGDIQNGNVMMPPAGLKLIDYDGMYVPGMSFRAAETGHVHFQHPGRDIADYGPEMDRFSFIVVDLSLRALIEDPSLYERFGGRENIVFRRRDFEQPGSSPVFSALRAYPSLTDAVDDLIDICRADVGQVPTLEDFLARRNIPKARPRQPRNLRSRSSFLGAGARSPAARPRPSLWLHDLNRALAARLGVRPATAAMALVCLCAGMLIDAGLLIGDLLAPPFPAAEQLAAMPRPVDYPTAALARGRQGRGVPHVLSAGVHPHPPRPAGAGLGTPGSGPGQALSRNAGEGGPAPTGPREARPEGRLRAGG